MLHLIFLPKTCQKNCKESICKDNIEVNVSVQNIYNTCTLPIKREYKDIELRHYACTCKERCTKLQKYIWFRVNDLNVFQFKVSVNLLDLRYLKTR